VVDWITDNNPQPDDSQADAYTDAQFRADMLAEYKPPADSSTESSPVVFIPLSSAKCINSAVKLRHRKGKFYIKLALGLTVVFLLGQRAICFTLSESDYAQGMDLVFGRALRLFTQQVFRHYHKFPYCWVEHLQGDKLRLNRHFIGYGIQFLDAKYLDNLWHQFYGSKLTGVEAVWSEKGFAFYLAKYLGKEEKFTRARFSQDWIFRGWWKFSKSYHKQYGFYPSAEMLVGIIKSGHVKTETEYLLETGYLSSYYTERALLS